VRLGELPVGDKDVQNSLKVVDKVISAKTPAGTGYYRYGTSTKGSEDGYGDCYVPDPTNCPRNGQPWPTTDTGSGHVWPVLSGERAETELALGQTHAARSRLSFMLDSASGEGLVPEQVWEDPDLPASPYGADPTTASIGFRDGHAAGSASPLTWAQAQELRLITDLGAHRVVDRPTITTKRYVTSKPPATVPVTVSSPAEGKSVSGSTTVAGKTAPGASVVVDTVDTDQPSPVKPVTGKADGDGVFSVQVPVGFGTSVITVAATTRGGGTGTAQVTVVGDLAGGTSVLDVSDPSGDDNGPGTYQYPTASDFKSGSFDITRFQVLTKGDTVYLRTTLRTLKPTFGATLGAQLLDVFVHRPGAGKTSTAAPYPSRNYSIASDSAWSQRIEVQGFAAPQWVDASGKQVGQVSAVVTSQAAKTVTIALPAAQFGTPASGWSFNVVVTGQDGYSADNARAFTATPTGYSFGVCATGGTAPICSVDPNSVPKAVDVIAPSGVSQSDELDPTKGNVALHGVAVQ
jgi:glucoamylase